MNVRKGWSARLLFIISASVIAALTMIVFVLVSPYENKHKTTQQPIGFVGAYRTQSMSDPQPLVQGDAPSAFLTPSLTLQGHFDRTLSKGEQLFFLVEYLDVTIDLNGLTIFSFGGEGSYPRVARSSGMAWCFCTMPQDVSASDTFTITLRSKYQNNYYSAYRDLIRSLCTGDSGALARGVFGESWAFILLGLAFFTVSLFVLLVDLLLRLQRIRIHPAVQLFACFALTASLWCWINPRYSTLLIGNPVWVMQVETLCMQLMPAFMTAYLGSLVKTKAKRVCHAMLYLSLLAIVLVLVLQLLGLTDAYAIRTLLTIGYSLLALGLVSIVVYEIRHNERHEFKSLVIPGFIFILCAALEFINYGLEWVLPCKLLFIGLLVLMSAQLVLAVRQIKQALLLAQKSAELERQLIQGRVLTMLTQIQPHFLFNTLTGIRELCDVAPKQAADALEYFAYFLRGNLDSLVDTRLIPFEKELEHVRNYLYLEKMRFGERVNVQWNIEHRAFSLPPLTLQPLVENAVRYGITKKENGGTVTIGSRRTDGGATITISDDGVGFDSGKQQQDMRTHVGIDNVKNRLMLQCGGTLDIHSERGVGTVVTILLPQEGVIK